MTAARRRKGGSGLRSLLVLAAGVLLGAAVVLLLLRPEILGRLRSAFGRPPAPAPTSRPEAGRPVPTPSAVEATRPAAVPSDFEPAGGARGAIALVIDDLGYSDAALARVAALPGPLTLAVLPEAPGASRAAALARERGWDLLVHLPMEAEAGRTFETLVSAGMSADEVARRVALALGRLPGAIGVNNHQGSKATADRTVVAALLVAVRERGLFFLDSRTTAATVVPEEARRLGVAILERDVFLDDVPEGTRAGSGGPEPIEEAWKRALAVVARKGQAVVLAHPRPETLDVLERVLPGLDASGPRLSRASDLVD